MVANDDDTVSCTEMLTVLKDLVEEKQALVNKLGHAKRGSSSSFGSCCSSSPS